MKINSKRLTIKYYRFANTTIQIQLPKDMLIPDNMQLFEVSNCDSVDKDGRSVSAADSKRKDSKRLSIDKFYQLDVVDKLAPIVQKFCAEYPDAKQILRPNMQILIAPEKECRIIKLEGAPAPYAVHIEDSPELSRVWVQKEMAAFLHIDTIFGSLLGLEKVMIKSGAMILHSAYMCREGKAVLFSAPSETGKSTQAGLWEKYRGTRQINGDRSLLVREADDNSLDGSCADSLSAKESCVKGSCANGQYERDKHAGVWYAYGWPICGSSEICHNEAYPIQAIVMLFQAKENTIKRLGPAAAMKKLMSQITMNMWNT